MNDNGRSEFSTKLDTDPPGRKAAKLAYLDQVAAIGGIRRLRDHARLELALGPGSRVLDAGSGLGEVARDLAGLVQPGGTVVALDRSADMTAAARARNHDEPVDYVAGDITALDYPDGSFDAARTERVLQHVPDPDQAIKELVRVVRPGGRVCLIDTDWSSLTADGLPVELLDETMDHIHTRVTGRDRRIGLSLRSRLIRTGARDVRAEPFTIATGDVTTAARLVPLFDPAHALSAGIIPAHLGPAWITSVAEAVRRDELLVALTIWVVTGRL